MYQVTIGVEVLKNPMMDSGELDLSTETQQYDNVSVMMNEVKERVNSSERFAFITIEPISAPAFDTSGEEAQTNAG